MKITRIIILFVGCGLITACGQGSDGNSSYNPPPAPAPNAPVSQFNPVSSSPQVPFPNNLLFQDSRDGTVNASSAGFTSTVLKTAPLVAAFNKLDGFSTTASAYVDFDRPLSQSQDFSRDIVIFRLDQNGRIQHRLAFGTSDVMGLGHYSVSGDYTVRLEDDSSGPKDGQRLLVQPLKPLRPHTRYLVAVTNRVLGANGEPAGASPFFRAVVSRTTIDKSSIHHVKKLSQSQKDELASIQRRYRPLFTQLDARGVNPFHLVNAWTFTTESIDSSLKALHKRIKPRNIALADTGKTTKDFGGDGSAEVYVGTVTLPYHQGVPTTQDPTNFINKNWQSAPNQTPVSGATAKGEKCANIVRPTSTTNCYPLPKLTALVTVPVLATVPLANGKVERGDPMVIFQHGALSERTVELSVADALAKEHLVGVSMDLPLHGITPDANPRFFTFYDGPPVNGKQGAYENLYKASEQITAKGVDSPPAEGCVEENASYHCFGERTFNYSSNGSSIDPSGLHFFNLGHFLAIRDDARSTVVGLMSLYATLRSSGSIPLVNPAGSLKVDNTQVGYFGHSQGAVEGSVFTAVESDEPFASVLASPGGQVIRMLLASPVGSGPLMALAKSAYLKPGQALDKNSRVFQMFVRLAQTTQDTSDPDNYVTTIAKDYSGPLPKSEHPIDLIETIGNGQDIVPDQNVPTNVLEPPYLGANLAVQPAPLAGTDPMISIMGLKKVQLTPPVSESRSMDGFAAIQFTEGGHSTVLESANSGQKPVTAEMQCEAAEFLASKGKTIPIGCGSQ